jgi:hypothetical protein
LIAPWGCTHENIGADIQYKKIPCLDKNYWSRPKEKSAIGDSSVDIVYRAVGRALSQWEMLEQRLANLFLIVCDCPDQAASAVRRAYGAIENGTMRRKALVEAAEVHFGQSWKIDSVQKSFEKVVDITSVASKRRDDIAHGIVHHIRVGDSDEGAFLFPPYYNSARTTILTEADGSQNVWVADFRFTSENILEYERRFGELKRLIADQYLPLAKKDAKGKIPFVLAVTGKAQR